MMTLAIWGAGGHGKVVLDVVRVTQSYPSLAFIDDRAGESFTEFCGEKVFAPAGDGWQRRFRHVIVAIGDNFARARCYERATASGMSPVTVVHPSAVVSTMAVLGAGSVIMPRAVVNVATSIGNNAIINTGAVVEHDCIVGDHAHISPGAILGGGVSIGRFAHVGMGAVLLPGASIGDGAVIGAGAVVLGSVPSRTTVAGVPAKVIRQHASV